MWIRRAAYIAAGMAMPWVSRAQTDYFNTDRGRPLHVQDATAIERYAFELQAAPIKWTRAGGSRSEWSIEPELAYGLLPRTQLEVGLPIHGVQDASDGWRWGVGALHVSLLHALNVETLGVPALALQVAGLAPAGDFGPRHPYASIGALVTRTMSLGRIHVNADATVGPGTSGTVPAEETEELPRWTAGVAFDRAIPLRSLLWGAELVAQRAVLDGSDVEWRAATGVRWQLDTQWAIDGGLGRSFGEEREWSLTFGAARSFGLVRLMPRGR